MSVSSCHKIRVLICEWCKYGSKIGEFFIREIYFFSKHHESTLYSVIVKIHFDFFCNQPQTVSILNRRAKEKRLKKDAGRTRWSQYFRSMKGGSSPRLDKLLDKDELKVDLDSFSHGEYLFFSQFYLKTKQFN